MTNQLGGRCIRVSLMQLKCRDCYLSREVTRVNAFLCIPTDTISDN